MANGHEDSATDGQPWPYDRASGYLARAAGSFFDSAQDELERGAPTFAGEERKTACLLLDHARQAPNEARFVSVLEDVMGIEHDLALAAAREVRSKEMHVDGPLPYGGPDERISLGTAEPQP